MDTNNDAGWCPTQAGNICGWAPQVRRIGDEVWSNVPYQKGGRGEVRVRMTLYGGDVLHAIGLCTYTEAMALAWGYAASLEGEGEAETEARALRYEVVYDIKARIAIDAPGEQEA